MPPTYDRAAVPAQNSGPNNAKPDTNQTGRLSATVPPAILTLPADVMAAIVELLSDPAAETELHRQICREIAQDAYQRGYRDGFERGARILEAEWPAVVKGLDGPTHEELETLRYGVRGREYFAGSRPTDRFPRIALEAAS